MTIRVVEKQTKEGNRDAAFLEGKGQRSIDQVQLTIRTTGYTPLFFTCYAFVPPILSVDSLPSEFSGMEKDEFVCHQCD